MKQPVRTLIAVSLYTLYMIVALPFYWIEGDSLAGHPVFAAVYFYLLIAHGVLVVLGVVSDWAAYAFQRRGLHRLASVLMGISVLPQLVSILVIVPLIIVHGLLIPKARTVS